MSSSPTSSYASGYDPKYGYNRNAFVHSPPHLRLIGGVLRHVIMPPIALAAEGLASRKDSSRRRSSAEAEAETEVPVEEADAQSGLTEYSFQGTEEDAQDWDLDEAVAGEDDGIDGAPTTASEGDNSLPSYLAAISTPAPTATTPRLPFPIIIPQRRPGTKSRGFIRAYAPVLENSNLASTDFTSFLQAFHAATQASPILNVIAFSCSIASTATTAEPITSSALFAAYIVAEAAKEVQERWRTNKFLEEANARIFKPRGLFCCVVTYKQSPANIEGGFEVERETVDIGANAIAKYGGDVKLDGEETSKVEELRAKAQRLRVASGETREAEMPVVCAPLVFPALEEALRTDDVRGLRVLNTKAKATGFVVDYFDRRSQAIFVSSIRVDRTGGWTS